MRVLQVVSYGYLAGGAERTVLELKNSLINKGHEVCVVSSNHRAEGFGEHFSDIEFEEIDGPGKTQLGKIIHHLWYPNSYRCVKQAVKEFKPDVVHFHTMGQLSPSAVFAIGKTPGVLTVHGPGDFVASIRKWSLPQKFFKSNNADEKELNLTGKLYSLYDTFLARPLYKAAFKSKLKYLIAISKYMEGVLEHEKFGVEIVQIYNGLELPKSAPLKSNNQLLFVGRLERIKGIDKLVEAMSPILEANPAVRLNVVGEGTIKEELESYVFKHELKDAVHFSGWLGQDKLYKAYEQATIVVVPSIWPEPHGLVPIEALSVGRPVVCSGTGALSELVVSGKTGLIVNTKSPEKIADSVSTLLKKDLSQMSLNCSRSTEKFSMDKFVDEIERLYSSAISKI